MQEVGKQTTICGHKVLKENLREPNLTEKTIILYSAPSDNACAGFGGCAIPISDSQLYPLPNSSDPSTTTGKMELYDFKGPNFTPKKLDQELTYSVGDKVYDVAWNAYIEVLKSRGITELPTKPAPDALRLAFPPST